VLLGEAIAKVILFTTESKYLY